jgi:hypothetical protein
MPRAREAREGAPLKCEPPSPRVSFNALLGRALAHARERRPPTHRNAAVATIHIVKIVAVMREEMAGM